MNVHTNVIAADDVEALEDRCDSLAAMLAKVEIANQERFPAAVVWRLSDGEPPVRVWREYRALSLDELAGLAAVPLDAVRRMDEGADEMSIRHLSAVARALRVNLDLFVPPAE